MTIRKPGAKRAPGGGRKRTSAGWATVGVRMPAPVVTAYRALPPSVGGELRLKLRATIEATIDANAAAQRGKGKP